MAKKKGNQGGAGRADGGPGAEEQGPPIQGALLFWAVAVVVHGAAAHQLFGVDWAPALLGLAMCFGLVGWAAGGGMTRAADFEQTRGVIGMALACLVLVGYVASTATAPSAAPVPTVPAPEPSRWVPPMPGTAPDSAGVPDATPPVPTNPMMGLLAAAGNMPPPPPTQPPTAVEVGEATERARRYFFGWLNGDRSVMENEASAEHARTLDSMSLPPAPPAVVPLTDIAASPPSILGDRIRFTVSGGGRSAVVVLGRGFGWEVVELVPAP